MSKKSEILEKAVFYANQKPKKLASILGDLITDVVTSVRFTGGADSIEIPEGDTGNTSKYTAEVLSQFGDVMEETITFSLKSSVTGVSLSTDTITVSKTATADSFTIVATSGSKSVEKVVSLVASN